MKQKFFLLSITKNCETLIQQTHRKADETLDGKLTKPKKNISFQSTFIDFYHSRMLDDRNNFFRSIYFFLKDHRTEY